jgi:hypothetical protein
LQGKNFAGNSNLFFKMPKNELIENFLGQIIKHNVFKNIMLKMLIFKKVDLRPYKKHRQNPCQALHITV